MVAWLVAFAVTQLVEVPIYFGAQDEGARSRRLCLAFGASAITHPVVWFVFPELIESWWITMIVAETFAVFVEAGWFVVFGLRNAVLWALVANGSSVAVGMALYGLGVI